jgi:Putative auto-transporter adhesin, head GIN domain
MTRLLVLVCLSACQGLPLLAGSGAITERPRAVDAFRRVALEAGVQAHVTVGPRAVRVRTDDNLQPAVETVVEGDTLVVRVNAVLESSHALDVSISNEALEGLRATDGVIAVMDATPVDTFMLSVSGGSSVDLRGVSSSTLTAAVAAGSRVQVAGEARRVTSAVAGGSWVDLSALPLDTLQVDAAGDSHVVARVASLLTGTASSGSDLTITGTPANHLVLSGGSAVHLRAP